jgi:hypothetical protein
MGIGVNRIGLGDDAPNFEEVTLEFRNWREWEELKLK